MPASIMLGFPSYTCGLSGLREEEVAAKVEAAVMARRRRFRFPGVPVSAHGEKEGSPSDPHTQTRATHPSSTEQDTGSTRPLLLRFLAGRPEHAQVPWYQGLISSPGFLPSLFRKLNCILHPIFYIFYDQPPPSRCPSPFPHFRQSSLCPRTSPDFPGLL